MNPLKGDGVLNLKNSRGYNRPIAVENARMVMHQNLLFDKDEIKWYTHFNRYGFINPYDTDQITREFLFFTKPDLYIYDGSSIRDATLSPSLQSHPFFRDADIRHRKALAQLQYQLTDDSGRRSPFMALLTNAVTSKMDLSGIQAEMQQSTPNMYGTTIDYRSHSIKSDNAYDFTLSFADTAYLEVYSLVKAYDEYMRLVKLGSITYNDNYKKYITARIVPEQFSIYKFLVGSDGETILYYAKATGVFFVDVPRGDFGDPGNSGFNYSVSFHTNFIEDNNPLILAEFNKISPASNAYNVEYVDVFNALGVNNSWARYPCIVSAKAPEDLRVARRGVNLDYRLKWTDAYNPQGDNPYSSITSGGVTPIINPDVDNYNNAGLRIDPAGTAVYKLYDSDYNYIYKPVHVLYTT